MSKATVQDLLDEGFRPEQFGFGTPATSGWSDAEGYLAKVLAQAANWAAAKVGAAEYAAVEAPAYGFDCLQRAEIYFSTTLLFKRRVPFLEAFSAIGQGARDQQFLDRREMLAHADAAWQSALDNLAEAIRVTGGDPAIIVGGSSIGHIETGIFPLAIAGALNG
jgi:hypothetical protein